MSISLERTRLKFECRLSTLDSAFDRYVIEPVAVSRVDRSALQEGFVSSLWQSWCYFCRELLIRSTQGAITTSGAATTSAYAAHSEMEIAYIAGRFARKESLGQVRALAGNHREHTWGDLAKLNNVLVAIGCSNAPTIQSGLSACLRIKDLQTCRNASAHISNSTIRNVRLSRVRYTNTSFFHPSDMVLWVDPSSSDFLWKSWVDEMRIVAEFSTH